MHDNILQSIGNRQIPRYNYGNNNVSQTASAVIDAMFQNTATPEKENHPLQNIMSPVLPGTASITHNVTRMLQDDGGLTKGSPSLADTKFPNYSTAHFLAYRQKMLHRTDVNKSANSEDDSMVDVENDSHDHLRTGDNMSTNLSLSTQGSASPHSSGSSTSPTGSSSKSSPSSTGEPVSEPDSDTKPATKKGRTNYTNDQVQTLMKIFHDNPYPDSEMMEQIGLDLGVPENKIKIWFQNKRARWRRRVNSNMSAFPQPFMPPMSPMLSPVGPYAFMPHGHMMAPSMTSSSPQLMAGYFNYAMQTPFSPNNNNNGVNNRIHPAYPIVTPSGAQQHQGTSTQQTPNIPTSSYSPMTSPPQTGVPSRAIRHLQYPQFLYPQQSNQQYV